MYKLVIQEAREERNVKHIGSDACIEQDFLGTTKVTPIGLQPMVFVSGENIGIFQEGAPIFADEQDAKNFEKMINEAFDLKHTLKHDPIFYEFRHVEEPELGNLIKQEGVPVEDFIVISSDYKVKVVSAEPIKTPNRGLLTRLFGK